jgi:DNA-binding transcriptional LysR family regulator
MDLRDLAYFEVIATLGHVGRAADRLGRTQPALSKCIDRLEDEIGTKLFDHVGRGLRLTSVGEILLGQAQTMRTTMDEAVRRLSEHADGMAGTIRIGISPATVELISPNLIGALLRESPNVQICAVTDSGVRLLVLLRNKEIDLILGPVDDQDDDQEFVRTALAEDELIIAAPKDHPLTRYTPTLLELSACRWLLPSPTAKSRTWIENTFMDAGLGPPDVRVESNTILFLLKLVTDCGLITVVSRQDLMRSPLMRDLCEVPIPALVLRRQLGVTLLRGSYIAPITRRLLTLLQTKTAAIFGL